MHTIPGPIYIRMPASAHSLGLFVPRGYLNCRVKPSNGRELLPRTQNCSPRGQHCFQGHRTAPQGPSGTAPRKHTSCSPRPDRTAVHQKFGRTQFVTLRLHNCSPEVKRGTTLREALSKAVHQCRGRLSSHTKAFLRLLFLEPSELLDVSRPEIH